MGSMETDDRTAFTERLAERGLAIHTFDGTTLTLAYNSAADSLIDGEPAPDERDLVEYARSALSDLPEASNMFPGLDRIVVDFGAL